MEPTLATKPLQTAICLFLIAGVVGLVVYPRHSVYAIGLVVLAYLVAVPPLYVPALVWLALLLGMTMLAEVYMATLRTWFYRAGRDGIMGGIYGGIIFAFVFAGGAFAFLVGTFLGALVGERSGGSIQQMLKNGMGVVVGLYGPLCFKLFMGLAMVDTFVSPWGGLFGLLMPPGLPPG